MTTAGWLLMRVVGLILIAACSRESADPFAGSATATRGPPPAATVSVDSPAATAGQATTATVTVTAPAGYHINDKYPAKLTLEPAAGVALPKRELTRADGTLDEAHLRIPVALTAEAGDHQIRGHVSYAYCKADQCIPRNSDVTIVVAAK